MTLISDIEGLVQDRLEESRGAGQFWSLQNEIRPAIVEALDEAVLLTGEPEVRLTGSPVTLAASTTLFAVPANTVAILRIEGAGGMAVRKTTVWDLDRNTPGWEADAPAALPDAWFPYGLTQFGIHPQLVAPITVIMTIVKLPVPLVRPFTGAETIDYQSEFIEGFQEYAAHVCRLKEGGLDFVASTRQYDRFLARMGELSQFGLLKDILRFTRSLGAKSKVQEQEVK